MGLENLRSQGLKGASAAALQKGLASLDSESLPLRFSSQRLTGFYVVSRDYSPATHLKLAAARGSPSPSYCATAG